MKHLIIDERMRNVEKETLKNLGYELIEIKKSNNVYEEISSHVDIFVCKIDNKIIVEPTQILNVPKLDNFISGKEKIANKYPNDIKYNVCTIGKKAIHNFEYTDDVIKQELKNREYKCINTTQGYTNCSIAVIDESSTIVTDKGLYKILQANNIETLYINEDLDIKLLYGNSYSNKNGFIGGCISRIGDSIIVFGDLDKIDKEEKIRNFILSKKLNIIEFKGLDIIDYGGIIEI